MNDDLTERVLAEWAETEPVLRAVTENLRDSLAELKAQYGGERVVRALMDRAVATAQDSGMEREEFLAYAATVLMSFEVRKLAAEEQP